MEHISKRTKFDPSEVHWILRYTPHLQSSRHRVLKAYVRMHLWLEEIWNMRLFLLSLVLQPIQYRRFHNWVTLWTHRSAPENLHFETERLPRIGLIRVLYQFMVRVVIKHAVLLLTYPALYCNGEQDRLQTTSTQQAFDHSPQSVWWPFKSSSSLWSRHTTASRPPSRSDGDIHRHQQRTNMPWDILLFQCRQWNDRGIRM